jgi:hypothetical protein
MNTMVEGEAIRRRTDSNGVTTGVGDPMGRGPT